MDKSANLTAGIRLEIPQHLLMTHKLLIMYGHSLRTRHGKETRRIVKFDLIEQNLYLAYKLPDSELWHDITPAMAKSYKDRENERSLLDFSSALSPPQRSARILTGANTVGQSARPSVAGVRTTHSESQTWTPGGQRRAT